MPPEGLPRPEEMWSGDVADASDDSHPISERTEEFEGRVWSVVRDRVGFGHHEATRDVIIHPGAVAVIAIDDEDRILLIRQYRHPVAMYMFEPPAGLLDTAGELPLETAKRELAEEAGVRASQWNVLVDLFNSPGGSSEAIRVFLARGLESLPEKPRRRPCRKRGSPWPRRWTWCCTAGWAVRLRWRGSWPSRRFPAETRGTSGRRMIRGVPVPGLRPIPGFAGSNLILDDKGQGRCGRP